MTPNNPKWQQHQDLFRSLLRQLKPLIHRMKAFKPQIAFELPKECDYWRWGEVQQLVNANNLDLYRCDGCMLGITNHQGLPLRKAWTVASSVSMLRLSAHRCDRNHRHGESRGKDLKHSENYTYTMTDCIHHGWKSVCDKLSKHCACALTDQTKSRVEHCTNTFATSNALAACCVLAAVHCTPSMEHTTAGIVAPTDVLADWWNRRLREVALASEYRGMAALEDSEHSVNEFYRYVPQPVLCEFAFKDNKECGHVAKIGLLTDQGLAISPSTLVADQDTWLSLPTPALHF